MEDGADLSGTESDVTVVLEYSDVVGEVDTVGLQAEHTQPDSECPIIEAGTGEGDTIDTLLDVYSNNSDISLDFGSDSEDVGVGTGVQIQTEAAPPKEIYKSIGFYNSMDEADQALHCFNRFVYTYRTRYLSPFVLGKVYQCRSHIGCDHRLKLATHRVDENTFRHQLLQRGKHSGTNIQLPARGISPVLKPELDALLKLGMSAGRVRNMLLFKYIREPDMLAHVPYVRKMENRKAYLKKKVTGGWEINKFIALRNWSALRMCQDRATFLSVDVDNFSDMNSMIVLHDFEHTVIVNEQPVESMGVIVTTRALFKNICRAVQDQGSTLVMSTDGTYKFHFGGWTLVDCGGISVESTDVGFVHRFRPWLYIFVRTESQFAYEQLFRTLVKYAREFYDIDIVSIRRAMSCTCKRFKHSGWVCSHIIASLHLLDKLNIERALETIPMRGLPGRPRSTRGGLYRDGTCAVDRLIEVFTKNPGRALKWPVVEEFEVVDDGVAGPDRRIGQVAACRLCPHDGVYIWTATFVDGDTAEYKVEELVHAIRRARDMSASV
ncbi:hypothetical protein DVH05_027957 [Phytophthora capsici]|nr:hypothetical protein DVH05_027957 [Phytophthora capsici]